MSDYGVKIDLLNTLIETTKSKSLRWMTRMSGGDGPVLRYVAIWNNSLTIELYEDAGSVVCRIYGGDVFTVMDGSSYEPEEIEVLKRRLFYLADDQCHKALGIISELLNSGHPAPVTIPAETLQT